MANDTARNISLTILQRLGLEEMLGSQKDKRGNNAVFYKLRRKTKLSIEEKKELQKQGVIMQVNGTIAVDEEKMAELKPIDFHFESEEVRKLHELGDRIELTPALMDWFEPIMEQLEAKVEEKPRLVEAS